MVANKVFCKSERSDAKHPIGWMGTLVPRHMWQQGIATDLIGDHEKKILSLDWLESSVTRLFDHLLQLKFDQQQQIGRFQILAKLPNK